uniref:N-acetyltransferase domain-containing protein n=1 Tax=Syphacia muris TaxID=451379 RepID=A0A0N5AD12_9BILA
MDCKEEAELNETDDVDGVKDSVEIVDGSKDDFSSMIYETAEENIGWLRKFRDYDCYEKMQADGFKFHHYAAKTKGGCYIGSCICIETDCIAFLSIYYVTNAYRNRGIGKQLLEKTFTEELRKKNIGICTVKPPNPLFGSILNFTKAAEWKITFVTLRNVDMKRLKDINDDTDNKLTVKSIRDVPFEDLVKYDKTIYSYGRKSFLKNWIYERHDCVSKVAVDETNKILGYGSARLLSIVTYPALSPIYCEDEKVFIKIMTSIMICFPEEMQEKKQISLWIPASNIDRLKQITDGLCDVDTGRQYSVEFTKEVPKIEIQKVYGISETMMLI